MAVATALNPGLSYRIKANTQHGLVPGDVVTIIDNNPVPDGQPNARSILVDYEGEAFYIIPRCIDATPVIPKPQIIVREVPAEVPETAAEAPQAVLMATQAVAPLTDPMDPRLDAYRPDPAKVKGYVSRIMSNGMTDVDFLLAFTTEAYREENAGRPANIMFSGDTQSGKTLLVEVLAILWAKKLGLPKPMPVFTLSGSSGVTDFDLFGQTTAYTDEDGKERLVWLHGLVDLAARVGGILYLDEVNAMSERVTSSLHPLADQRHMFVNRNKPVQHGTDFLPETVTANVNLWLVGTINPGYRGMSDMNEAFAGRFRHLPWDYDDKVEAKLISSPAVLSLASKLRTARSLNKLRTPVGTAALQRLERDLATFGIDAALEVFVGMFKVQERDQVRADIIDGSIKHHLVKELGVEEPPTNAQAQMKGWD
jgi:MoxR-like ATPase